MAQRIPIIDITDLYHPYQDPGDNFDLLMAYGLPEIDLRAVILDVTDSFRQPFAAHRLWPDTDGPRDPGFIPVTQLNYLFGRSVPCAAGPFQPMRAPDDALRDIPRFQQAGVDLILDTLRQSAEPVEILAFGSARALAVAYNRAPDLLRAKVRRVHISAGAADPAFLEWNVELDPHAMACVLRSGLPLALYPCASGAGAVDYHRHNTFWTLPDMQFIRGMRPALRRYLGFAFGRVARMDFLRALDGDLPDDLMEAVYARSHSVWETAVWIAVSRRRLVARADGSHRIIPAADVAPGDRVLPNDLRPCVIEVRDDGTFSFALADAPGAALIYDRGDPRENERALREALPALYQSFEPEPTLFK